ncbi:MAG: ABC transporter permease [Gammaproteobacteria bacterium]
MARLILSRLMQAAIVLLVMSFVIYALIGLMPGDPIDLMISADPNVTTADAQRLKALYGLDRPIVERWFNWFRGALSGDFGHSRLHARPVVEVLVPALLNTLKLLGLAFVLSLLIALPAGIWAGLRPYSAHDYTINLMAFAGISIPVFWFALMLIIVFAVILGVLPAGGTGDISGKGGWDQLRHLVLPVVTLSIASIGGHTRYMRGAMIEVMRQDYILTARAKGAGTGRVVFGHALRNALIPVVTILALEFGTLFSGALVTETIFAWPGMGRLIYDSIMGNDFNLALVALLLATLVTLAGNLLADLAYAWLDPRIEYQ